MFSDYYDLMKQQRSQLWGEKTYGKLCKTREGSDVCHCCSHHNEAGLAWCIPKDCSPDAPSSRSKVNIQKQK